MPLSVVPSGGTILKWAISRKTNGLSLDNPFGRRCLVEVVLVHPRISRVRANVSVMFLDQGFEIKTLLFRKRISHQALVHGIDRRLDAVLHVKFLENVAQMNFDRVLGDA